MPFCERCKMVYPFDELLDQTIDGVGDINCPQCGAVLTADKIEDNSQPVDRPPIWPTPAEIQPPEGPVK
jgi:transcription initiation factor IIE alpha subunit